MHSKAVSFKFTHLPPFALSRPLCIGEPLDNLCIARRVGQQDPSKRAQVGSEAALREPLDAGGGGGQEGPARVAPIDVGVADGLRGEDRAELREAAEANEAGEASAAEAGEAMASEDSDSGASIVSMIKGLPRRKLQDILLSLEEDPAEQERIVRALQAAAAA